MTPIFEATIQDSKLLIDKGEKFRQYLIGLNGKRVQVTVERLKHTRSNNQNAYYWGVVVKLVGEHTGHDGEQIHEALKQLFSPKWYLGDKAIPTSTTRLDTFQFEEYLEKCRHWAQEFLGVTIPLPNEVAI